MTLECGHIGSGKYCHRCADEAKAKKQKQAEREEKSQAKEHWKQTFDADAIDLKHLPRKDLVLKARELITQIVASTEYTNHGGKRLNFDRTMISVPLGREFRILFRDTSGELKPLAAMSHEEYNRTKPGA
ncbi:MAG: hypothetical protein KDA58_09775 [Planctomycetaceae bacterium]|nr:hypothetical protein [Planctomycetaceae bacterium]